MLSIADILKEDDLPAHKVDVPEWGGVVYVATLRADERDAMEALIVEKRDATGIVGISSLVVAYCLCDDKGQRLFANDLETAAAKINRRSGAGVQRIFNKCSKINGLSKGDLDDLEKKD